MKSQNKDVVAIRARDKQVIWCIDSELKSWARIRGIVAPVTRHDISGKELYISNCVPEHVIARALEAYQRAKGLKVFYAH